MGHIEDLAVNYERHLSVPWQATVAGAQRVMLCVYNKEHERTLRARLGEFEIRTKNTGHAWREFDCTALFAMWLASDDYCEAYFESPGDIDMAIEGEFKPHAVDQLRTVVKESDSNTVVAVTGVAAIYGFLHVSELIRDIEPDIKGRLVVFFPGSKEGSNYRLLDARDGWNYLANSITAHCTGGAA